MAEAIQLALSMIKICQENEACKLAVDKVSSLQILPEMMRDIRNQLCIANSFITKQTSGTKHSEDEVDERWIATVRRLAFTVKEVTHKYLYHALRMQEDGVNKPTNEHAHALDSISVWMVRTKCLMEDLIRLEELSVPSPQLVPDQLIDLRVQDSVVFSPGDSTDIDSSDRVSFLRRLLTAKWNPSREPHRRVVSVVGCGGIGKTALVRRIYAEAKMKFGSCAFVTLSKKPDVRRSLADMLCQIIPRYKHFVKNMSQEEIIDRIKETLEDDRYLIVIDNIWEKQAWNTIETALPNHKEGESIVIAITILNDVAKACSSGKNDLIYTVKPLTQEESKSFLDGKVGSVGRYTDEILKMCSGMPLALQIIGSLLAGQFLNHPKELMDYLHSTSLKWPASLSQVLDKVKKTLFQSCSGPPYTLEICSLYLSTLPENSMIERNSLIQKWIAEGLISEVPGQSPEDVANENFDQLINRNVIQPVGYGYGYEFSEIAYRVHPMMLCILRQISRERRFASFFSDPDISIDNGGTSLLPTRSMAIPILVPSEHLEDQLTVLDLEGRKDVENLVVGNICRRMILLRYLGLRKTSVTQLPLEIVNLQNLEALDVRETGLKELPRDVVRLSKLALLLLPGGVKLPTGPGVQYPNSLKVLSGLDSQNFPPEFGGLKQVNDLDVMCHNDCSKVFSNLPGSLQRLKVAGRCVNVPASIENFSGLTFLDIRVCKLGTEGLRILGNIGSLQTLVLKLVCPPAGQIIIRKDDGFRGLENFALDSRDPWVSFEDGAMSSVKQLGLKLYAGLPDRIPSASGLMSLDSLEKVVLHYTSRYEGSSCVKQTVEVVRKYARQNTRPINLSINGKEEIPRVEALNSALVEYVDGATLWLIAPVVLLALFVPIFFAFGIVLTSVATPHLILSRLFRLFDFYAYFLMFIVYLVICLAFAADKYKNHLRRKLGSN